MKYGVLEMLDLTVCTLLTRLRQLDKFIVDGQ